MLKKLGILMAALAMAAPASAITYTFDYLIGTSNPNGLFVDFSNDSRGAGDVRVVGQVSTDGTVGREIDENNIQSWTFTLSGPSSSMTISSLGGLGDGGSGNFLVTNGRFFATAVDLVPTGNFRFAEFDTIFNDDGSTDTLINGDLQYLISGPGANRVQFQTRICPTSDRDCSFPESSGFGALNPGRAPIGLADVSTIPLPASAYFLIVGLGGLVTLRRRVMS